MFHVNMADIQNRVKGLACPFSNPPELIQTKGCPVFKDDRAQGTRSRGSLPPEPNDPSLVAGAEDIDEQFRRASAVIPGKDYPYQEPASTWTVNLNVLLLNLGNLMRPPRQPREQEWRPEEET